MPVTSWRQHGESRYADASTVMPKREEQARSMLQSSVFHIEVSCVLLKNTYMIGICPNAQFTMTEYLRKYRLE